MNLLIAVLQASHFVSFQVKPQIAGKLKIAAQQTLNGAMNSRGVFPIPTIAKIAVQNKTKYFAPQAQQSVSSKDKKINAALLVKPWNGLNANAQETMNTTKTEIVSAVPHYNTAHKTIHSFAKNAANMKRHAMVNVLMKTHTAV